MSNFDGIDDVTVSESLPYIDPGNYVFSADRLLVGTSSRKGRGDFFVAEFTVVTSSNPNCPPGTRLGYPLMFAKEMTLVNIKAMMAALAKCMHQQITKKVMDAAVEGDGTRLAGKTVVCQATASTTKDGRPFTKMNWSFHEGQEFVASAAPTPSSDDAGGDGSFSDDEIPF